VVVDVLLALALVGFAEVELRQPWDDGFRAGSLRLDTLLVALLVLPVALRTAAPRLGLLLMVLVASLPGLLVPSTLLFWGGVVPVLGMVFTVARRDGGWAGRHAWAAYVPLLLGGRLMPDRWEPVNIVFGALVFGFAAVAGRAVRRVEQQRRALAEAVRRLHEEQKAREAEAVAHERRRIAAEMHDVVSHAVSLMVLQVGAARMQLGTATVRGAGPDVEAGQLLAAERAGREALDELRRSVGVLRGSRA
jgi:signal transduction histidine kinase